MLVSEWCSFWCGALMPSPNTRPLGTVTWRDEQGDAGILEHQAAAAVIHLSSRKHQQFVHQLAHDGLALGRCVQFLVEGGHLRQSSWWAMPGGLICWQGDGLGSWLLLDIWLPAGPHQPSRTVPPKALDQKEDTGHRDPHQQ